MLSLILATLVGGTETGSVRLEALTRPLLGVQYHRSPLGEGVGHDSDPRFRLDAFDCTTFVETAIALASKRSEEAPAECLDRIRYSEGKVLFEARRHLVTTQWIPELQNAGVLTEVTQAIGGKRARSFRFKLSRARWKRRRIARSLKLPQDRIPEVEVDVWYVPVASLRKISPQPGTVVSVVRKNVRWSPIVVTHQGLLVERDGAHYVRHASTRAKKVVDEPWHRFIRRLRAKRKWPIVGINFQRVLLPE